VDAGADRVRALQGSHGGVRGLRGQHGRKYRPPDAAISEDGKNAPVLDAGARRRTDWIEGYSDLGGR
jgi:hypothetical protein